MKPLAQATAATALRQTSTAQSTKVPQALGKTLEKSLLIDSRAAVEESAARKRRKVEPKPKQPKLEAKPAVSAGQAPLTTNGDAQVHYKPSVLPVEPKFSVQSAMNHLCAFDPRFKGLFAAMKCRPFVEPFQAVDPFRTLATSIVGQQVR